MNVPRARRALSPTRGEGTPWRLPASIFLTLRARNDPVRAVLLSVRRHLRVIGRDGDCVAQSCALGAVPDPGVRQRVRPVRADGRRVSGDDPGRGLCRRGRGAVPVRDHDARRRFHRTARGLSRISADRSCDRRGVSRGAAAGRGQLGYQSRRSQIDYRGDPDQGQHHRGARPRTLYKVHPLLPDRRHGAAGRDDRRHRADAAPQGQHQAAGHQRAERTDAGAGDGGAHERGVGAGAAGRGRGGVGAMTIGLGHYLAVGAILFTLGILGIFLNRKNIIVILMSIELILLAVNINLVAFSAFLGDIVGQVFALLVLTVAAAEAAIGLAVLVVYYRNRGSIAVEDVNLMKG